MIWEHLVQSKTSLDLLSQKYMVQPSAPPANLAAWEMALVSAWMALWQCRSFSSVRQPAPSSMVPSELVDPIQCLSPAAAPLYPVAMILWFLTRTAPTKALGQVARWATAAAIPIK